MLAQNQAANQNIQGILGNLSQFSNGQGPQNFIDYSKYLGNQQAQLGTSQFMTQEQPILRNIMQDTAARFGGLNNTAYTDRMQEEQLKSINPAMERISENAALVGPQLTKDYIGELSNMLTSNQNVTHQNLADYLAGNAAALNTSNTGNADWLKNQENQNNAYQTQLAHQTASPGMQAMGAIAPIAGSLIGSVFGPVGTALGGALGGAVGSAFGGGSSGGGGGGNMFGGSTGNAANELFAIGGV